MTASEIDPASGWLMNLAARVSPLLPRSFDLVRIVEAWREVLLNSIIGSRAVPKYVRPALLRAVGADVHASLFGSHVTIKGNLRNLSIGPESGVNVDVLFDIAGRIDLGTHVYVGHGVKLISATHEVGPSHARAGALSPKPVRVGDGAWIGSGAIILPGVTIGAGCIIAAGAVVTKDCEPDCLYGGVPAQKLRALRRDA